MANIGETAKQLYHAVIEINQLITSPSVRFQMMEAIRGSIYYVCNELAKHFLNQSVVLPEKQKKIANLAQALQLHLANGYKLVVRDQFNENSSEKTIRQLAPACQRALTDLSRCVVRASQLYCQSPPNVWLEIHQLFLFAHRHQFDNTPLADDQLRFQDQTTIANAYKRILLLGCSKPNQMRQNDIGLVFDVFECWTKFTELEFTEDSPGLFLVDPNADAPPHYRALQASKAKSDSIGFNTSELMNRLTEYIGNSHQQQPSLENLEMPLRLADNVLMSLSQALGILTKRTYKRIASSGKAYVTVGLSAYHYFSGNEVDFNLQLANSGLDSTGPEFNLNNPRQNDIWASSFDSAPSEPSADMGPINYPDKAEQSAKLKNRFLQHTLPLVNTSPGGYCVQWQGAIPGNVQAGELLGIREEASQPWNIGVIRWIRQMQQTGTQFGIELLAPSAKPCGVQLVQKTGERSEFLRGLLLPELPSIGQPTTLITPRLPFQTNHKVILNKGGRETKVQLTRRVSATSSFSQFEINFLNSTMLTTEKENREGGTSEDEFDSLWPTL